MEHWNRCWSRGAGGLKKAPPSKRKYMQREGKNHGALMRKKKKKGIERRKRFTKITIDHKNCRGKKT